jgi:FtsP/CotA-like multicopper oxidase with cupredoxin domain
MAHLQWLPGMAAASHCGSGHWPLAALLALALLPVARADAGCGLGGGTARDYRTAGQPLHVLPEVDVADYYAQHGRPFELELGVVEYAGPEASFRTRGYCGAIPGPVLVFKRGNGDESGGLTHNRVDLINRLESRGPEAHVRNRYSRPSTTNIHTHGLHLPHLAPGDDIKIHVEPQHNYSYVWPIVSWHAPGTFWYHPHVHGSTSLQVGGGALGMLVIEDEERDALPPWLLATARDEVRLVIQVLPQRMLADIEAQSGADPPVITGTGPSNLLLVNGQLNPVISMANGRWYRWRVLFSSLHHRARLDTPGCEFGILAKDGVYLLDAPRPLDYMQFASGNRVDVIIRCSSDARLVTTKPLEYVWPEPHSPTVS